MSPRNHVRWGPHPPWEGAILGKWAPIVKYRGCAKMAEPLEMPFGILSQVHPSNHVVDWGTDPHEKGQFWALKDTTRMWANTQRGGRPAECRWRPLFNAAKFGWRPVLECCAVILPRCDTRWNLLWCPKLANRSRWLVGQSSPYCEDMWGRHWFLTDFFRLSIRALVAKI